MSHPDFHQILGVTPSASAAEIKRAFKRLAMRWHPDRNADPQAHEQFRLAREAFEHLTGVFGARARTAQRGWITRLFLPPWTESGATWSTRPAMPCLPTFR